jgi:dihydrofolate reductase
MMRKLTVFNFITLNGFYKGLNEDIGWHKHGGEEAEYSEEMLALNNVLLFGRKTYENMVSFWPTPMAKELFPKVAEGMNKAEKIVFSTTLSEVPWKNTMVMNGDIVEKVRQLKQSSGNDLTILGSGSIINLFTDNKLIDEYQIMLDPIAIGEGNSIFSGIKHHLDLKLTETRAFKSGVVLLIYKPV